VADGLEGLTICFESAVRSNDDLIVGSPIALVKDSPGGQDTGGHEVRGRLSCVSETECGGKVNVTSRTDGTSDVRVHGSVDVGYRDELVERFALDPAKKVRAYSKGNRQKLCLIAALMTRADLLLLDEPTSGLDPLMEQEFRHCVLDAKAAGQTVLLSSHILSEVEALADRVAILRAGELVETGTLADMRHLTALSIEATFSGSPPDVSRIPGVTGVEVQGNRLRCQVQGPVEPLLKVLTAARVTQLLSREPSLEELFLAYYDSQSVGGGQEASHVA
jgi:ABC-2 type transport system ATP-binding protein